MRLKYYKRMIGQMRYRKPIILFWIILLIIILICVFFAKEIIPTIKVLCETKAKAIATTVTNDTIDEYVEEIEYDNLMKLNYDNNGKLLTINANINELNKLSAEIISRVQEKLSNINYTTVKLPLGKILGLSMFAGYGPSIEVKLIPAGNVSTEFKTEFTSQGINQTKHTVYVEIYTSVTIVAPFSSDTVTAKSTVTIAETIIIGEIPTNYYNLEGLGGLIKTN